MRTVATGVNSDVRGYVVSLSAAPAAPTSYFFNSDAEM
jgi:hypothetical protein